MQFKDLEWKDIISENIIVSSTCEINLCGWINPKKISIYCMLLVKAVSEDWNLRSMVQLNQLKMQRIGFTVMKWQG